MPFHIGLSVFDRYRILVNQVQLKASVFCSKMRGDTDPDTAGARAGIEDAYRPVGREMGRDLFEGDFDQTFRIGARDQDSWTDCKFQSVELGLPRM
jgi:hypothetical protein